MAEAGAEGKLYTLTEIAKLTKISMPTLQRYKKMFNDRIPSVGEGRSQRYLEAALDIFNELKNEQSKKRGRPRKTSEGGRAAAVSARSRFLSRRREEEDDDEDDAPVAHNTGERLLTLKEIEEATGISYPTLLRYVKTSVKRIPHRGMGRKRRFLPEAVAVFKTLREESRRGRKAGMGPRGPRPGGPGPRGPRSAEVNLSYPGPARLGRPPASESSGPLMSQLRDLQRTVAALQRQVMKLEADLHKPFKVVLKRG